MWFFINSHSFAPLIKRKHLAATNGTISGLMIIMILIGVIATYATSSYAPCLIGSYLGGRRSSQLCQRNTNLATDNYCSPLLASPSASHHQEVYCLAYYIMWLWIKCRSKRIRRMGRVYVSCAHRCIMNVAQRTHHRSSTLDGGLAAGWLMAGWRRGHALRVDS